MIQIPSHPNSNDKICLIRNLKMKSDSNFDFNSIASIAVIIVLFLINFDYIFNLNQPILIEMSIKKSKMVKIDQKLL